MSTHMDDFSTVFSELRRARRIKMRGFEHVGIRSSYISAIEKTSLLPSSEKLDGLIPVFVQVAGEQKAADPEDDGRLLREAHGRTQMARLGMQPDVAGALAMLKGVADEATSRGADVTRIAPPVEHAAAKLRANPATLGEAALKLAQLDPAGVDEFLNEVGAAVKKILNAKVAALS